MDIIMRNYMVITSGSKKVNEHEENYVLVMWNFICSLHIA